MSMWRLWHDNRTIKQIQEGLSELYEQPNPQKAWLKAMYEQDKTFRKYVNTIEKKLKRDWDFICCEDRDAYLLYTLIDECYWQNQMHNASYKVICAEDLSGNVEGEYFVGKKVLILGIVLNRRLKMFECYCQLKKLGVGQTVSIVFGFNVDAYGLKDYEEVHQSRINQIYCDILGTSEDNTLRAKESLKDWSISCMGTYIMFQKVFRRFKCKF